MDVQSICLSCASRFSVVKLLNLWGKKKQIPPDRLLPNIVFIESDWTEGSSAFPQTLNVSFAFRSTSRQQLII